VSLWEISFHRAERRLGHTAGSWRRLRTLSLDCRGRSRRQQSDWTRAPYRDDVTRLPTASLQASSPRPALHELQGSARDRERHDYAAATAALSPSTSKTAGLWTNPDRVSDETLMDSSVGVATDLPPAMISIPAAVRVSNVARGARVNTRRNLKPETGSMKAVRPLRIFAKGRTRYMASKLKDQRRELCTNDDSANCQPYGLASLVAAPGLGQAPADQVTDRQQRDQEPALVGAEPLTVIVDVNHPGGDQDTED